MPAWKQEDEINAFTRDFANVAKLGLLKLNSIPKDTIPKTSRRSAEQPNPMRVSGDVHRKDVEKVKALIQECDKEKRPLNKLSDQEKLELLLRVMSEINPLNLQRDRKESHKPRTVDEVLKDKKWDCDEIARVYTAIAWDLGISDVAQFVARLRDKETGEVVGHAAVLYKTETGILYLDPATGSKRHFEGFTSFDDLIENKDFQNYLSDICSPYNESKAGYDFVEGAAVSGKENADAVYYYELGNHHSNQKKDAKALSYYENASEKGMKLASLSFNIGQCHYFLNHYEAAIKSFDLAIIQTNDKNEKTTFYGHKGSAYLNVNDYQNAFTTYTEMLRLASEFGSQLQLTKAKIGIGRSHSGLGGLTHDQGMALREKRQYSDAEKLFYQAINQFDLAEKELLATYTWTKDNAPKLADSIKKHLRITYINRHRAYEAIGKKEEIEKNLEKSIQIIKEFGIAGVEELEKALQP